MIYLHFLEQFIFNNPFFDIIRRKSQAQSENNWKKYIFDMVKFEKIESSIPRFFVSNSLF